jgi:hypothetical protein
LCYSYVISDYFWYFSSFAGSFSSNLPLSDAVGDAVGYEYDELPITEENGCKYFEFKCYRFILTESSALGESQRTELHDFAGTPSTEQTSLLFESASRGQR